MISKMLMPKVGDLMETGLVAKWLKKEGDAVKRGEAVLEITTDKATLEVEVFVAGTLLKILVAEGQEVPVGGILALIGDPSDEIPKDIESAGPAQALGEPVQPEEAKTAEAGTAEQTEVSEGLKASPRARRAAKDRGVALSDLQGTGPGGRIVERDVLQAQAGPTSREVKSTPLAKKMAEREGLDLASMEGSGFGGKVTKEDVQAASKPVSKPDAKPDSQMEDLSPMRRVIAERMAASKREIPHFYLKVTVDMSRLSNAREELNESKSKEEKLSFNDFFILATAKALIAMPAVNSRWANGKVERVSGAHVGVAVSLDEGLMVPVVKQAHQKDIWTLSREVRALAAKARGKRLTPQDYSGGTFTVSNLGMFGIEEFQAIVNPPESGILSVGAIRKAPVVVEDKLEVRPLCTMCLSADHRVIDGAQGAKFLTLVKNLLEHPYALFCGA